MLKPDAKDQGLYQRLFPLLPRTTLIMGALLCLSVSNSFAAERYSTGGAELQIKPLVHSSVEVAYGDLVIQIDPWSVLGTNNMRAADLIIVTDNPGHHLDTQAIAELRKPGASVVTPNNSQAAIPDAVVLEIGDRARIAGVDIEAIAAYDIIQGAPEHPRGDANGYVLTVGGLRLFFAGVTECVEEVRALEDIDIAFMPMNIPPGRMTPQAAAECTRHLAPDHVYVYHYDQGWARRQNAPDYEGPSLPGGYTVAESLDVFARELEGSNIEFVRARWYPD